MKKFLLTAAGIFGFATAALAQTQQQDCEYLLTKTTGTDTLAIQNTCDVTGGTKKMFRVTKGECTKNEVPATLKLSAAHYNKNGFMFDENTFNITTQSGHFIINNGSFNPEIFAGEFKNSPEKQSIVTKFAYDAAGNRTSAKTYIGTKKDNNMSGCYAL